MSDSEKNYEVYHSQIETAQSLFEKFKPCFGGKKFRKLHVLITNPSNRKLKDQCKDNLKKFMEGYYLKDQNKTGKFSVSPNDFEYEVIHVGQLVGKVSNVVQNFFESAKKKKDELFLIIQDECHWGVRSGSLLDEHIFSNDGCGEKNLFFLHVSATPYNMKPIINTDRCVKIKISEKYYGLSKCIEKGNLKRTQLQFSNKNDYFMSFVQSYLDALDRYHGLQENNKEVKEENEIYEYVKEMISKKKMILVRLPRKSEKYKFGDLSPIDYFYSKLFFKLEELNNSKIEFEIIKDGNNTEDVDYSKCEDKACLVLVVQKGGLGINFPKSLILQDLRMRYTSKFYFSTFFQDIGRSFGYNKSPSILISQHAFNTSFFYNKKIKWDALIDENGNLKKEHFNNKKEKTFSDEINDRNFLLDAEPQVGKTGCFFWLIKLLHERSIERKHGAKKRTTKGSYTEFARLNCQVEKLSISKRNEYFLNNHQKYMHDYDERSKRWEKKKWEGQKILKHFAVILSFIKEKKLKRIYDFGAGNGKLEAIVKQSQEWNPEWHSFDLVKDEENNVKECDHYRDFEMFENLKEEKKPDCILFSFSLFGKDKENVEVIKKCFNFLAKGGNIVICSTKHRNLDNLVDYSIERKVFEPYKNTKKKTLFYFSAYEKKEEEEEEEEEEGEEEEEEEGGEEEEEE